MSDMKIQDPENIDSMYMVDKINNQDDRKDIDELTEDIKEKNDKKYSTDTEEE